MMENERKAITPDELINKTILIVQEINALGMEIMNVRADYVRDMLCKDIEKEDVVKHYQQYNKAIRLYNNTFVTKHEEFPEEK